jgi:CubicO group peptidase (beta-lactamase class C family)
MPRNDAISAALAGIGGSCQPAFTPVAEVFAANFTTRGELGASVCIELGGEKVLDLWGGHIRPDGPRWEQDTIHVVFSCTKAATALVLHLLVKDGALDLDAPLAGLWPELTAAQQGATARMILDHSIGLPAVAEKAPADALVHPDWMRRALERQIPFWQPGTRVGYHALTYGFLAGEVVQRITGQSLGQVFRNRIATPLGLDVHIGLPEAEEARVAPIQLWRPGPDDRPTPFLTAAREAGSIPNLFVFNSGDWGAKGVNTREGRAAEIGAANGVGHARALARMFGALATGGAALGLTSDDIATFSRASSATGCDATLQMPTRFGPGFMLGMDNRHPARGGESLIFGRNAFGHVGAGGSIGFADPEAGLSFAYTMNRQGAGLLLNPRGQSLIDATYRALGYRTTSPGFWAR